MASSRSRPSMIAHAAVQPAPGLGRPLVAQGGLVAAGRHRLLLRLAGKGQPQDAETIAGIDQRHEEVGRRALAVR